MSSSGLMLLSEWLHVFRLKFLERHEERAASGTSWNEMVGNF